MSEPVSRQSFRNNPDCEPLDTEGSLECAPAIALALLCSLCVLFAISITLAPFVRYLQAPGHDGAPTVWGSETAANESYEEGMKMGPRAPVQPLPVLLYILLGCSVLSLCASGVYAVAFEKKALDWFENQLTERRPEDASFFAPRPRGSFGRSVSPRRG
eukprot:Protomagalhaensia_sp_Gyna_25__5735@NODE_826_length_2546_cov_12_443957_g651_i0_p3_GENE_NODE_826_length_2546_cov_12_443957_g651_i0NODE_826_length_2546_cov_12_443957_g651_i0_p3_ORF_typecomplete_len159_score17_77TMEM132D_C/PF15706_5/9_5e02TMEM132D_C/PF15706_5/0_67_NODE_826_length_2546_cov_12_443957_g651_i014541930